MHKKEGETRVVFKMTPAKEGKPEPIAFIMDAETNVGMIMSYMHVGQHSEASEDFCRECRLAKPEEYADLKEELISIGYNVVVRNRLIFK